MLLLAAHPKFSMCFPRKGNMYIYLIVRQNWDRPSYTFWLSQGRPCHPGHEFTYSVNSSESSSVRPGVTINLQGSSW